MGLRLALLEKDEETAGAEPWVGPFGSSRELWPATDKDDGA